jgi:threonine aldolase
MRTFDLRSDTFTKPSEGMRRAMYEAEVGDDVFGEDPTVKKLEEQAADLMEKERALFVTSGTMGNLISLYLCCGRGNEFLVDEKGHILTYEMGAFSVVAGCVPIPVKGTRGILDADLLTARLKPAIYYLTQPTFIVLENTHNFCGGTCYSLTALEDIREFADRHSLSVHMDGARMFNASAATQIPVGEMARFADTVTFCLSKGLGAPVGSLLCGSESFISEARRVRKMLGGGMRQSGILAAAGLYALAHNVERIPEDHENARSLAAALAETSWARIRPEGVASNIVLFDTGETDAYRLADALGKSGVLSIATGDHQIRMVTHLDISRKDIGEICRIIGGLKSHD